jgi:hypothetical protein
MKRQFSTVRFADSERQDDADELQAKSEHAIGL